MQSAAREALPLRADIYRALAAVATDQRRSVELTKLANDLESIAAQHDQLLLDFKRRAL